MVSKVKKDLLCRVTHSPRLRDDFSKAVRPRHDIALDGLGECNIRLSRTVKFNVPLDWNNIV